MIKKYIIFIIFIKYIIFKIYNFIYKSKVDFYALFKKKIIIFSLKCYYLIHFI